MRRCEKTNSVSEIKNTKQENLARKSKLTTETNVTLDLSPISLVGESPVARFGFFRGLKEIISEDRQFTTADVLSMEIYLIKAEISLEEPSSEFF